MAWDFSLVWSEAIFGIAIFAIFHNIAAFVIGILLVGAAQHGFSMIAHEGAHYLIAPGRKRANDFIARWFFAAPAALPFALYRQRHLLHHQHVGTDEDTKSYYRRDIRGARLTFELLLALFGIDYFRQVFSVLSRDRKSRLEAPRVETSGTPEWVKRDIPAIVIVHLILFAIFSLIDWRLFPALWVLPNVTVAILAGKTRSLVEHRPLQEMQGTDPDSPFYMKTSSPCLRSVRATWIERVLLSKVNFHFHAEHHFWPFVSYQYLPEVHRRIVNSSRAKELGFTFETSYIRALQKLWCVK
jgi:fatty acid desaturase